MEYSCGKNSQHELQNSLNVTFICTTKAISTSLKPAIINHRNLSSAIIHIRKSTNNNTGFGHVSIVYILCMFIFVKEFGC